MFWILAVEDKNLMITITPQNEISFYDLAKFENRLTIISKKNNEWIAYAPTGEFVSSINGTDKVYWSLGDGPPVVLLHPFLLLLLLFSTGGLDVRPLILLHRCTHNRDIYWEEIACQMIGPTRNSGSSKLPATGRLM